MIGMFFFLPSCQEELICEEAEKPLLQAVTVSILAHETPSPSRIDYLLERYSMVAAQTPGH